LDSPLRSASCRSPWEEKKRKRERGGNLRGKREEEGKRVMLAAWSSFMSAKKKKKEEIFLREEGGERKRGRRTRAMPTEHLFYALISFWVLEREGGEGKGKISRKRGEKGEERSAEMAEKKSTYNILNKAFLTREKRRKGGGAHCPFVYFIIK